MNGTSGAIFDLGGAGKVALVTGGAAGLGRACAEAFAGAGYRVLIADIDAELGAAAAAELDAIGPGAAFVAADVGSAGGAAAAVGAALARWGRLDLVLNNAGIAGRGSWIESLEEADLERVLAVNLKGPFYICKHAVAAMRAGGGGVILNVSSITADAGSAEYAAYAAAKAGVTALTRSLARRLGRFNIRINCLNPGSVEGTGLMREAKQGLDPAQTQLNNMAKLKKIPVGRAGRPNDVASLALFLASPLARHIHGAIVTIDGGESLGYQ